MSSKDLEENKKKSTTENNEILAPELKDIAIENVVAPPTTDEVAPNGEQIPQDEIEKEDDKGEETQQTAESEANDDTEEATEEKIEIDKTEVLDNPETTEENIVTDENGEESQGNDEIIVENIVTDEIGEKSEKVNASEEEGQGNDETIQEGKEKNELIESAPKPKKENGFKRFLKKYKIAVIISAIILLLAGAITTTILVINAPKLFIKTATDFTKETGKKEVFVLKKDITIDGNLIITEDLNFNLNNKTLTVNGTLKITLDDANTNIVEVGTQKGFFKKKPFESGGKIVADKVEIVAKGITLNVYSQMTFSGSINVNKLNVNEKLVINTDESLALQATNAKINKDVAGTIDLVLSNLTLAEGAAIDKINADNNSIATIYGTIKTSLNGGKEISLLGNASCPIINGATDLYIQQETVTLGEATSYMNFFVVKQLEKPSQLNIEQFDTTFIAVASAVNGADIYIFIIKDETGVLDTIESPTEQCDITDLIKAPKSYKVSVSVKGENARLKLASTELEIDYNYNIKLSNPQITISETENDKIVITFPSIPFAKVYKLNINGKERSIDAQDVQSTLIDITDDVQNVGSYYIKVAASYPGNSSFTDSDIVMISYITYQKFEQPALSVDRVGDTVVASWEAVANCKNYILRVNGIGYMTTSTSKSFAAELINDETTFVVYAQGIGYYETSDSDTVIYSFAQLDPPTNLSLFDDGTTLAITADAVNNATDYVLYKNGIELETNTIPSFEISDYTDGDVFKIKATAPYYKSASSEATYIE